MHVVVSGGSGSPGKFVKQAVALVKSGQQEHRSWSARSS
jgi:hypothetical protein